MGLGRGRGGGGGRHHRLLLRLQGGRGVRQVAACSAAARLQTCRPDLLFVRGMSTQPGAGTAQRTLCADALLTVFRCRARRYLASKQMMRAAALSSYDGVTVWSWISRYLDRTQLCPGRVPADCGGSRHCEGDRGLN